MPDNESNARQSRFSHLPLATSGPQDCALTGTALLRTPYFNKGSAFTSDERKQFKLHGLLPPNVQTLDAQVDRAYEQYRSRQNDLAKNTFMASMKDQNIVLYYKLLQDHIKEMFPVIYTPTEGSAIASYSRIFRKPEGCFLNIEDQDRIDDNVAQFGDPDAIDIVVVSDGEQILGIGDQGVGAILISSAKLVLYTLCAGIHPSRTLPVVLDCGTNNDELLKDDLYLGLRRNRVRGEEYETFIAKFMQACGERYPKAYIHFEDFGLANARRILDKYTPTVACFNDDVQGTACVALAAMIAAMQVSKLEWGSTRTVIFGAGTAGTGIADQIKDTIVVEAKKSEEEARKQIWCIDKPGLLLMSKKSELTSAQISFAREENEWGSKEHSSLLDVIKEVRPHVLIGTSTKPGAFSEEVVREMAKHVERPIILPLSNPTQLHEAKPQDLFDWSDGKALVATGSPFPPVDFEGKTYEIAECNNSTCFPGIALGAVLCRARLVTPALLVAATQALARQAPILKNPRAGLLPDVSCAREISVEIAKAVIRSAREEDLNQVKDIPGGDDLEAWIGEQMWDADYRPLRKVDPEKASAHAKGEAGIGTVRRGARESPTR